MWGRFERLSYLLLHILPTWVALNVTVPSSPIQARPGSDVQLPCHMSGTVILDHLAVMWKIGEDIIAKYEGQFTTKRQGALMTVEQLRAGDASLFLPNVHGGDAAVYTCFIIHVPENAEKSVELRIEAPPRLSLNLTKLQLLQPGSVTCTASDFYPSTISITWFQAGKIVKGPESPHTVLSPNGLYNAWSVLKLTPRVSDDGANFSCRVNHTAIKGLLEKDFELQVQARPILQVYTVPPEKNFGAARCLVSGFYPGDIQVLWLKNGIPQPKFGCHPQSMPNGTFSIESTIFPEGSDAEISYGCRVQHEALEAPLEWIITWQPKATSASPTDLNSDSGIQEVPPTTDWNWLIGISLFGLGLLLGVAVVILYYKVKFKSAPERTVKKIPPEKSEYKSLTLQYTEVKSEPAARPKSEQVPVKKEVKDHAMSEAWREKPNDTCVAELSSC